IQTQIKTLAALGNLCRLMQTNPAVTLNTKLLIQTRASVIHRQKAAVGLLTKRITKFFLTTSVFLSAQKERL
ncbi:MAG TPA: hypothetical protein DCQ92_02285, partial [Verrucomicrobia subdivision 3 bacterium]|nr:hypothetical protein [Limisphaerales bacterium]